MLIKCPDCASDVSDAAGSCPRCGHPLRAAVAPPALAQEPSMAGSYLLGPLGSLVRFAGAIMVLMGLVGLVFHGPAASLWLLAGIAAMIGGGYLRYKSAHTVRVGR